MAKPRPRTAGRKRGASRGQRGSHAWLWLFSGVLIGLGLAYYLFAKGYIPTPEIEQAQPSQINPSENSEAGIAQGHEAKKVKPERPRYDFFTVLPEMEVVVAEEELKKSSNPASHALQQGEDNYLLQVGSFRQSQDAEQLKARLALLGMTAKVQSVSVDGNTWHRVRIGPVSGARQADDIRSRLAENGIESLRMKNP